MSNKLVPANLAPRPSGDPFPQEDWQEARPQAAAPVERSPIERPLAAIRRYKWLIAIIVLLSTAGGVIATRFLKPVFEVQASIMLSTASPMDNGGPIRSQGLLAQDDWIQLLKSFVIADKVVRELNLYLKPSDPGDSLLFRNFAIGDRTIFSQYELLIDRTRKRWTLSLTADAHMRDSGGVADSVGKDIGFLWQLPKWAFNGAGQRKVQFTVATPREVSMALTTRLAARRPDAASNFLILSLTGPDRELTAHTVNTWLAEYVRVAGALKTAKLSGFTKTLGDQFHSAKLALDSSEMNLQSFRVNTITMPNELGAPIAAGLKETESPVTAEFFKQQVEFDNTKHDIAALQGILKSVTKDSIPADVMLQVQSVSNGGAPAQELLKAFQEYYAAQTEVTALRVGLQDAHPRVKQAVANVATLKNEKIPRLANQLLTSLKQRALDDSVKIVAQAGNLKEIPLRTIEEERYRRARELDAGLFANLQTRYAEAQLAEASASPDVTILDTAIAPLDPAKNKAPIIVLGAIFGGLAAAIGLALALDQLDGRLRYPEQASEELGIPIAGTVPRFPKGGADHRSPEQMFQLVESFRSLRMSIISNSGGPNVSLAVSSPSPGEGKSLISANLAMSFADAGLRTVIVDGDTRRGTLHEMFGIEVSPGLTDYLAGTATIADILRPTAQDKLMVIPCGMRQRRNPELLTSPLLVTMVDQLKSEFDVVIFDTPPLAAGIDAYSIAVAAGSLALVLRVGQTERRMAAAKMRMFERLPVEVVGAVLNGIEFQGEFEYYGYVGGYAADEEPGTAVADVP